MQSKLVATIGVILLTVGALTACSAVNGDASPRSADPTSSPRGTSPSYQGQTTGGLHADPEIFHRFMIDCMADEGWAVVGTPTGAVSPVDDADSADPAFNDAITGCLEQAAEL